MKIPFNKPPILGSELEYISQAMANNKLCGDGEFTKKCQELMINKFQAKKIMLTPSCTHALEMAAILAGIEPGDEVICPSYTFVSSVNSFVLRGGIPKFVDIREDTLNLDENLIEEAITERTKAIMPVDYAGIAPEMDVINRIAKKHGLVVIEDAAQGVNATYNDQYLGTLGDMGTFSFHETKNYSCGEGGALVINNPELIERAEIIREKGANRSKFLRGEVDKYTWVDVGSSYLLSDMLAAFLYAQLLKLDEIKQRRCEIFEHYYIELKELEEDGLVRLPIIPDNCETNYHLFYLLMETERERDLLITRLKERGIHAVFHYVPLHTSPMGQKFGYERGSLPVTEELSSCLIRLPMYYDLTDELVDEVVQQVREITRSV